jgi:AraC-like DNA-binding protein
MNHRLHQIQNWPQLAQQANWCATTLAEQQGVCLKTLQRFFKEEMGKSPKKWLLDQRNRQATKLLKDGFRVKETADKLCCKHPSHLTNSFKKHYGHCPTDKMAPIRAQTP